ncbi:hypothetical protein ATANTOWER_005876 [Ataeniobius toweri]|uniref:Uncharacterized protein n=1 Tax=Ataeniobius toweri TaxID=208326 RepID=A0ABU7ANE4_9TELE|nr:hypothetical protein [Ataeniobius toweri]
MKIHPSVCRVQQGNPVISLPSDSSSSYWGIAKRFQARCEITSLQRVLGLPGASVYSRALNPYTISASASPLSPPGMMELLTQSLRLSPATLRGKLILAALRLQFQQHSRWVWSDK